MQDHQHSTQAQGLEALYRQLTIGSRVLSINGHDDFNQGQISARLPGANEFLIKAAVKGFDDATAADMVPCLVDATARLPSAAPPETPLHQAIYAARPEVGAIVHSHAEHATVFGATDIELKPISHEGAYFNGKVARFDESSHTILDEAAAFAVARALGNCAALFLCNHGIVVVANTLRQAVVLTLMLERACRLQLLAESLGKPYRVTRDDEIELKRRYIYSAVALRNYWNHAAQAATRLFPDIAHLST